ncbi:MAG TPA: Ig-like domain-containing protein [Armatimonadota bacterium]
MQTSRRKAGGFLGWMGSILLVLLALGLSTSSQIAQAAVANPTLTSSSPVNGAEGVLLSDPIVLTFDVPVNLGRLNAAQNAAVSSDRWVQISPSLSGGQDILLLPTTTSGYSRTVNLVHAVPFDKSTLYTVNVHTEKITGPVADAGGDGGFIQDSNGAAPSANPFSFTTEDQLGPYITSHTPVDGDVNQPTDRKITVNFNKAVDPSTVQVFLDRVLTRDGSGNPTSFETVQLGSPTVDNATAPKSFTFSATLLPSKSTQSLVQTTTYRVRVLAKDSAGRDLRDNPFLGAANVNVKNPFFFSMVDTTKPLVSLIEPLNNPDSATVSSMAPIVISFDEPMDSNSIVAPDQVAGNGKAGRLFEILVNGADPKMSWTVSANDNRTRYTFSHSQQFPGEQQVTINVKKNDGAAGASIAKDSQGNPLDNAPSVTFKIVNTQAPSITAVSPTDDPAMAVDANGLPLRPVSTSPTFAFTFNKPMDPTSLSTANASLLLLNADGTVVGGQGSPAKIAISGPVWDSSNTVATFTPSSPLNGGPTRYKLQLGNLTKIDLNTGNIIDPDGFRASLPKDVQGLNIVGSAALGTDFALSFITADTTGPAITDVQPRNGATNVSLNHDIVITFDSPVIVADSAKAPLIELRYAAQELEAPRFGAANPSGTEIGVGFLRANKMAAADGQPGWNAARTQLVLRPDVIAGGTTQFRDGQTVSIRVTNAQDVVGNGAGVVTPAKPAIVGDQKVITNPFQYDLVDTRIPHSDLMQVGLEGGSTLADGTVGLRSPLLIKFNKSIQLGSVCFVVPVALDPEAVGHSGWNATFVPELSRADVNVYRAADSAYSNARKTVTVTHVHPFAPDINSGATPITLLAATLRDGSPAPGLNPIDSRGIGISAADFSNDMAAGFKTGHQPVITAIEYELPNAGKALKADGTIDGHYDDLGVGPANGWGPLPGVAPGAPLSSDAARGNVPLNARIRVQFNGGDGSIPMDISTTPLPSFLISPSGENLNWTVSWRNNNTVAIYSHNNFTPKSRFDALGRAVKQNGDATAQYAPYLGFVIAGGRDIKGDDLRVGSAVLQVNDDLPVTPGASYDALAQANSGLLIISPYDVMKPTGVNPGESLTIEFLTNPGEGDQSKWVWAPLTGASASAVLGNTKIRVTANEPLKDTADVFNASSGLFLESRGDVTTQNPTLNAIGLTPEAPQNVDPWKLNRQVFHLTNPWTSDAGAGTSTGYYDVVDGRVVQKIKTYKLKATIRDRSLIIETDQGDKTGNRSSRDDLSITPKDLVLPVLSKITFGDGSLGAGKMKSTDNITLTFSEPVDPASVTLQGDIDGDNINMTGINRLTTGGPATDIVFSHDKLTTSPDKYLTLFFRVKGVKQSDSDFESVKDAVGNKTGNGPLLNDTNTNVPARSADKITVQVTDDISQPSVMSVQAARNFFVAQFDKVMKRVTNNDQGDFANSVYNTNNYQVNYSYQTVELVGGVNTVVTKTVQGNPGDIQGIVYDESTRSVRVTYNKTFSLPTGGSNEQMQITLKSALASQIGNTMVGDDVRTFTTIDSGLANWKVRLDVSADRPGTPGGSFIGGVSNAGGNGFDQNLDIPNPPVFTSRGNVSVGNVRTAAEFGDANAGTYGQDILAVPGNNEHDRTWANIEVRVIGLGSAGTDAPLVTIKPNLAVTGAALPGFYVAELQEVDNTVDASVTGVPDGSKSYDLRNPDVASKGISFRATTSDPTGNLVKKFKLIVHLPELQSIDMATAGFNLVSLPLKPVDPVVEDVLYGILPNYAYRYNSTNQQYESSASVPEFRTMEAGRGYWVRPASAPKSISVFGVQNVGLQSIALKPGWNLIGNPFSSPAGVPSSTFMVKLADGTVVPIAQALSTYGLDSALVTYDGTTSTDVEMGTGTMLPKKGYWVYLADNSPIKALLIPPTVQ